MMLRRTLLLNIALASLLVAGGFRFQRQWLEFETTHRVDAVPAERDRPRTLPIVSAREAVSIGDWTEILAKYPFSFDRNDIAVVPPEGESRTGPRPVLFGTISIGAERMALLGPGQPGNRGYRAIKAGETVAGWQVVEIQEKSVIVVANGVRETLILNDPSAQVPREHTRTLASSGAVQQSVVVQRQENPAGTSVPAPAVGAAGAPAPAAPGQQKGRYIETPFGRVFVADPPK